MIVYFNLGEILKERNMIWKDLCESGISANMPQKFSQNKTVTTETIDKECAYLKIQTGDIMEWVDEKEQEKVEIQRQIEALQKKLAQLEKEKANLRKEEIGFIFQNYNLVIELCSYQ